MPRQKLINLKVGYNTSDEEVSVIQILFTPRLINRVEKLLHLAKTNKIDISFSIAATLLDEDGNEVQFRRLVERFHISESGGMHYETSHKNDSSQVIESSIINYTELIFNN